MRIWAYKVDESLGYVAWGLGFRCVCMGLFCFRASGRLVAIGACLEHVHAT